MRRTQTGITLAAVLVVAVVAGFASGKEANTQKITANTDALKRGCRDGGFQDVNRTNPSWVSVDPSEQAKPIEGMVVESKVTPEDYPANHESHDWNFFVIPDPKYAFMASDANHRFDANGRELKGKEPGGQFGLEMEWETKHFDMRFWPVVGDRATVLGRWIFDCGHPPYRTEIHPPKFAAFTRLSPHVFSGDTAPSYTNKAFVYINGQGGYFYDHVGGTTYNFDIPLPARPTATAELRAQVIETPFGGPTPTLTPVPAENKVRASYSLSGVNDPPRWNLYQNPLSARPKTAPKFGAIIAAGWREPVLTKAYRVLRVTFDTIKINDDHDGFPAGSGEWKLWLHANGIWDEVVGLDDADDGDTFKLAKTFTVTVPEDGALAIQTTGWESDEIDEHFRMDTAGSLPINATSRGLFSSIKKAAKKAGSAVKGAAVKVGSTVKKAAVATGGAVKDTAVAVKNKAGDAASAVKDKIMDSINNEEIGTVSARFTAANNFGIGSARDDASTAGDFRLRYHIEEVKRIPAGTPIGGRAIGPSDARRMTLK